MSDFPFLDLPRELRDLIYNAVLKDARADFLLAQKPEKGERGFLRPPLDILPDSEYERFGYTSWEDYLVHEQESGASILYYRLIAPTSLLRTCKQVAQELRKRLDVVDALVASSIHLDRFVENPEPAFLDICGRSCFALRSDLIGSSTRFLHTLPASMCERITSVVLGTKTWLSENMSNKGLLAPVFEQLPALRELGVLVDAYTHLNMATVPGTFMYEQLFYSKRLGARDIDVLRLMYRRPPKALKRCPFMLEKKYVEFQDMLECMSGRPPIKEYSEVGQVHRHFVRACETAGTEEEKRQMLPMKICHEFEEWPGMDREWRRWSWVGAGSVVKLTRADEAVYAGRHGLLEEFVAKFR